MLKRNAIWVNDYKAPLAANANLITTHSYLEYWQSVAPRFFHKANTCSFGKTSSQLNFSFVWYRLKYCEQARLTVYILLHSTIHAWLHGTVVISYWREHHLLAFIGFYAYSYERYALMGITNRLHTTTLICWPLCVAAVSVACMQVR